MTNQFKTTDHYQPLKCSCSHKERAHERNGSTLGKCSVRDCTCDKFDGGN